VCVCVCRCVSVRVGACVCVVCGVCVCVCGTAGTDAHRLARGTASSQAALRGLTRTFASVRVTALSSLTGRSSAPRSIRKVRYVVTVQCWWIVCGGGWWVFVVAVVVVVPDVVCQVIIPSILPPPPRTRSDLTWMLPPLPTRTHAHAPTQPCRTCSR
jgi:hypothetical protein